MIYGLIPVGGKGVRLGLPYSKEMLPQKNFNYYNPIINHLVEKMEAAGAEEIILVHGLEIKQDVLSYFNDKKYRHLTQITAGFSRVLGDFYQEVTLNDEDKVLFGLPDTVFDSNLFMEMLYLPGMVCGLFKTDPRTKVDRLDNSKTQFQIKTEKTNDNCDWFWGVLKFDASTLQSIMYNHDIDNYSEIGHILNIYDRQYVYGDTFFDLGTWENYNKYLNTTPNYPQHDSNPTNLES